MSSTRLHQEEESWLRYPEPHIATDSKFSFQKQPSFDQTSTTFGGYLANNKQHFDTSSTNNKRPLSTEFNASSFHLSTDFGFNHTNNINNNRAHAFSPSGPSPVSASFASSSSPTGPQPRTLSEELAMALQQQPPEHNFNTSYPSPTTPSGFLSSPADLSMPSSSSSSFSSSSSSHFPLFKPRNYDTSSLSTGQQGHRHNPNNINYDHRSNLEDASQPHRKPRPSPLALYANPTDGTSSHYRATGSPTSAISRDTTTAHDIVGSPQTAMATATASAASFGYMGTSHSQSHYQSQSQHHQYAGATSPLSRFHHLNNNNNNNNNNHGSNHGSRGNHRYSLQGPPPSNPSQSLMHPHYRASSLSVSSGASTSSYSTISSPTSSSPPCFCHSKSVGHRPGCHKSTSTQTHHPACQHHTHFASTPISSTTATAATNTSPQPPKQTSLQLQPSQQQQQQAQYAVKFGRATKGVSRFGTPRFTPEFDPTDPSYASSFSRSNRRLASASDENNGYGRPRDYDDDAMDVDDASYASEPPKKKQRSTASILLGAAVETVIFTGAVALSAYQLLTGKGKLSTTSSASHSKQGSTASDVESRNTPASEGAMQEDEKSVKQNTPARPARPHYSTGSLGRTARGSYYHKAKTPRSFRTRQSLSGSHNIPHATGFHARSSSMPVRPNTGTEETDEAFLRMEAQLSNLISEGKRALSSRIEVWDEE
ncbi:hypothetical protein BG003_002858 [Podila horticola]|nr:hypothetical protein BG003_002858 [Podila horticola]